MFTGIIIGTAVKSDSKSIVNHAAAITQNKNDIDKLRRDFQNVGLDIEKWGEQVSELKNNVDEFKINVASLRGTTERIQSSLQPRDCNPTTKREVTWYAECLKNSNECCAKFLRAVEIGYFK